jgi:hypothetical protein
MLAERIDRLRDSGPSVIEVDLGPPPVLSTGELDSRNNLIVIDHGRTGDRSAVHSVHVIPRDPDAAPLSPSQV